MQNHKTQAVCTGWPILEKSLVVAAVPTRETPCRQPELETAIRRFAAADPKPVPIPSRQKHPAWPAESMYMAHGGSRTFCS